MYVQQSAGGDCFDVCEGHPPVKVIDYENECMNDNHDPGCLCGYGRTDKLHFLAAPEKVATLKADPYMPGSPNLLYFKEIEPATRLDKLTHYWVLTDHLGVRLAASIDFYGFKEEAIDNAIAIFGKEVWAGIHSIPDHDDYHRVLNAGIALEAEALEIKE